jgi:RNA ligase (TIGR02306 family)
MRKLATIRYISELKPIEGADLIEVAVVDGWNCVVKKGDFEVRQMCVYFEIDSFLPLHPVFEFLRKNSYKKMGDYEGFRLKTIRLKGVYSQGLLVPIKTLIDCGLLKERNFYVSEDLTQELGIQLYEPPIPAQLSGSVKGNFPSFLIKTDEERVQNLEYYKLLEQEYYVTEKLDGSSITIYLKDDIFGVCSRNLDLIEDENNTFWKTARGLDIESKLKQNNLNNISLQGELIGEGVQGNKYKIKGHSIRFFNVFNIEKGKYFDFNEFKKIIEILGLQTVPILDENFKLPDSRSDLLIYAEGKSILYDVEREGIVLRTKESNRISFKAISNKFLLKED